MMGVSSATVLVVDDDDDMRTVFTLSLGHVGYRVITASSSSEALRAAREEHPQAVVLDLSERAADGWEVVRRLKASPATSDIPVVMVIGWADLDYHKRDDNCAAYLPKPVRLEALCTAVDSAVRGLRS